MGCCLPVLGSHVSALQSDGDIFFAAKAFVAGVILVTGFIHILPDAFDDLSSDCLPAGGLWKDFPFAGFGAMVGAIDTLVVDTNATGYFRRFIGAKASASSSLPTPTVAVEHHHNASNTHECGHRVYTCTRWCNRFS
jgi:zinc transporter 1/2/3